jgi:hypothetical protein
MATIDDLRRLTNEPEGESKYNDDQLEEVLLKTGGSITKAAAIVWEWKAASAAELVDMQEGPTSRKLSDLQDNALRMAELLRKQADDEGQTSGRSTTIGRITRA